MKISKLLVFSVLLWAQNCVQAAQDCNPSLPETAPASRFITNKVEGLVTDKSTKLTWKICAEGQIYSGGRCSGKATVYTWDNAMSIIGSNVDNWRLPNEIELASIVENRCKEPSINMKVFPDMEIANYWTSSTNQRDSSMAGYITFSGGDTYSSKKDSTYQIRLVRGKERFDNREKISYIWREMDSFSFCIEYGNALRKKDIHGIVNNNSDVTEHEAILADVIKNGKKEAARRGLRFNDSIILKGQIAIGISDCQLYATFGIPEDENHTIGRWGTHTQHVYSSGYYVYTENGRVTSWQQ